MEQGKKSKSTVSQGMRDAMKKATAEMLVLFMLRQKPMYTYQIAQEVNRLTQSVLSYNTMYLAVYRLQENGFIEEAKKAGADRFRYCDTVGIKEPFSLRKDIEEIYKKTNFNIEMHTHNDFGMATANAIAGILGGASHVGVTVNGLGERAGNAALEEVLMALEYLYGYKADVNEKMFREVSQYVAQASGRILPAWKAIVGENMFAHESGIHADGAIKNPKNYEAFDPDVVGLQRQIVIGKHSGKAGIINKFKDYNINLTDEEAKGILELVRAASVRLKRTLFDKELVKLYKEYNRLKEENNKEN